MVDSLTPQTAIVAQKPQAQTVQLVQQVSVPPQEATWGEVIKDSFVMGRKNTYLASSISNDPKSESKKEKLFILKVAGTVIAALAIAAKTCIRRPL
jgi:hypothetical protein